jgi:hypothetical protein
MYVRYPAYAIKLNFIEWLVWPPSRVAGVISTSNRSLPGADFALRDHHSHFLKWNLLEHADFFMISEASRNPSHPESLR